MPIMRLKEIRSMSSEERAKKVSELKTELSRLKTMISAGGAVENSSRIRELRKTIAQILTIDHQQKQTPETAEAKPEEEAAEKTPKTKEKQKK